MPRVVLFTPWTPIHKGQKKRAKEHEGALQPSSAACKMTSRSRSECRHLQHEVPQNKVWCWSIPKSTAVSAMLQSRDSGVISARSTGLSTDHLHTCRLDISLSIFRSLLQVSKWWDYVSRPYLDMLLSKYGRATSSRSFWRTVRTFLENNIWFRKIIVCIRQF